MANRKKKKGLSHQQVGGVIAAFGVFLLGGIVWAATVGQLQISGSVNRGDFVDIDIVSASCVNPTSGLGEKGVTALGAIGGDLSCGVSVGNITGRSNGANDRLEFGMFLSEPGATDTVQFYIQNVGSVSANLHDINVTSTTGFAGSSVDNSIVLGGTHSDLVAQCIAPGGVVGPFTISATWPASVPTAVGGAIFCASIDYSQSDC
jgi:hypothetical protein